MKVMLTGGSGFIGAETARRLKEAGHELRCLVRSTSDVSRLRSLGALLTVGDVTERGPVLDAMQGCDWVINVAAAYAFWLPRKRTYARVNIGGTRNVMECALEARVGKVVHVSTVAVYGRPSRLPITEESAVGPARFSEYARTKYEGDLVAWGLQASRGLPLVVIYPAGVLGPGDPKATGQYIQNVIRRKMPATVASGSIFPWVHVRDVAEAIVRAAEKDGNIGEKYLVTAENLTFGDINRMISEISGVPLPRFEMPGLLAMAGAALLTLVADIVKKPPPWGMALDQIRTMKAGAAADGSKAARELGIAYTPVRVALEEAIASYRR
jgi:dihydroflavonol-4-reductase